MNGDWEKRITELEVLMREKWAAHDKASEERWEEIRTELRGIREKICCDVHSERMSNMSIAVKTLYGIVVIIIGWIFTIHIH